MRRIGRWNPRGLAAAFGVAVAAAGPAVALEGGFGVRAGVYADGTDGFAGADWLLPLANSRWALDPNAEIVFVEGGDLVTASADLLYDFGASRPVSGWAGGGLALLWSDRDRPGDRDGDVDVGVNLLAGVGFEVDAPVAPYVQGKIILADDSEAVVAVGVRF